MGIKGLFSPNVSADANTDGCEWVWDPFQTLMLILTLMLKVNGTGINQCDPSNRQR